MELGDLINTAMNVGGQYIKYKYGGEALQALQQPMSTPIQTTPAMSGAGAAISRGLPYVAGGIAGLMIDEFGNLVERKKKRRRRRRLATASDLRDLAALQGILGKGTAFTTWIATHSSH